MGHCSIISAESHTITTWSIIQCINQNQHKYQFFSTNCESLNCIFVCRQRDVHHSFNSTNEWQQLRLNQIVWTNVLYDVLLCSEIIHLMSEHSITCLTCRMTIDHALHLFMRPDSQNSSQKTGKPVKRYEDNIYFSLGFFRVKLNQH